MTIVNVTLSIDRLRNSIFLLVWMRQSITETNTKNGYTIGRWTQK